MKRVITTLNEMSFDLPKGWALSEDIYSLPNGQGMINKENYISDKGEVISLFEVKRDPDDFFIYYDNLVNNYIQITQKYSLAKKCNLKVGEFILPTYIIKGFEGDKQFYCMQVFVNCGDCLACFMLNLPKIESSMKKTIENNHVVGELVKILRTVE